jgi:ribonuclease D
MTQLTSHRYIDQQADLLALLPALSESNFIALDTEFVRRNTYRPQLCLVQCMTDTGLIALLDALTLDLLPFWQLLDSIDAVKIFHDSRQDLEIVWQTYGRIPEPIYDTQLAALLLKQGESCSFAKLVEHQLGITLNKDQTATDWSQRPLTPEQLQYAIDDVYYLAKIYPQLTQALTEQQQDTWLDDDHRALTNPSLYQADLASLRKKLKAPPYFKAEQKARLDQLLLWRESIAIQDNKPRQWIINNSTLLQLADRAPRHLDDLHTAGMSPQMIRKHGEELINRLKHPEPLPATPKLPAVDANALTILRQQIEQLANDWNIRQSTVIASKNELTLWIAHNQRPERLQHGWRNQLLTQANVDALVADLHQQTQSQL